jgi:5-methyltetrahydropteroyltriglutamate--homocysteine methyltransferase
MGPSMKRSKDRILTTHAGSLPRPEGLHALITARAEGKEYDKPALESALKNGVREVVKKQIECGVDSVNDGELGKINFNIYVRDRLSGHETRPYVPGKSPTPLNVAARDMKKFPDYFTGGRGRFAAKPRETQTFCVGPLKYVGHDWLKEELDTFKAALTTEKPEEAFLPANTPGTIEHWMVNQHYKNDEEFLFAIAEAMREEYEAIVNAGFLLQIDDPDLPDGWQAYPELSVADYRKHAELRIAALNHGLRNIPREKVRLHVCWGSFHGPHQHDIPLRDIADLIFSVKASAYSIEASNPCHQHEWQVFETVKVPQDAVLIPGVIGHYSDFIEHPELVAERLVRYAKLVGRENVMAGTDCGLGNRVGTPMIAWAKLASMAEGARIATKQLWGRA